MSFPGVAVVIGAGSGIGRATAKLFAQRGCRKIAIGDVSAAGLAETKQQIEQIELQTQVLDAPCDVTSEDSVNAFISKVVAEFNRIDYACNVAGILMPGSSIDFAAADFDKQFTVNARGMWLCQRAELMQMVKQEPITPEGSQYPSRGTIANVASMAALRAYDSLASYCTSKTAILAFTKADAYRHAKDDIRVNAVCPGVIQTPLLGAFDPTDSSELDALVGDMAMRRPGQPEEVAEGMLWLCSANSSLVTGIALPMNGGMVGA